VMWIPSVQTVVSLRTFSREVNVMESCINNEYTKVSILLCV